MKLCLRLDRPCIYLCGAIDYILTLEFAFRLMIHVPGELRLSAMAGDGGMLS